ncbi:MAG: hypothetical protein NZ853_06775 [Leptospiraceae bacterium]|nr:hypothetical protein [Leptospiraceae bacterium]MDW7975863.1 hypothetical protein [Leptospiraceae bacterium]
MKNQLQWLILISIFGLALGTFHCQKKDPQKTAPLDTLKQTFSNFEILFLKKSHEELKKNDDFLSKLKFVSEYTKEGNPTNYFPVFQKDGCFYSSDPFYFHNEFGLAIKYCSSVITENYQQIQEYLHRIDEDIQIHLPTEIISFNKKTLDSLTKESYLIVYHSFLDPKIQKKFEEIPTELFFFSDKSFDKNQETQVFIPKRFFEVEYGLLIQEERVHFLYKLKRNFLNITIKDKSFAKELISFFTNFPFKKLMEISTSNSLKIDKLLFQNKKPKMITLSSQEDFVILENPKNQKVSYFFPYTNIVFDLDEFDYTYKNNQLEIFTNPSLFMKVHQPQGNIHHHWLVNDGTGYVPLSICLWNTPCSVNDLNHSEFEDSNSIQDCDLSSFILTELNPFGLYSNDRVNAYGKFIEIYNNKKCSNKIYLSIDNVLVPFPDNLLETYYVFAPSDKYILYENLIQDVSVVSLKPSSQIDVVQFFPYKRRTLFSGIHPENSSEENYFIYGDKQNGIFKDVHSLVLENQDWGFHSHDCMGLSDCHQYGMSPGYENPKVLEHQECRISEIFIGGPYNHQNKRLSSDEFIEIECKNSNTVELHYFKIKNNDKTYKYFFPTPKRNRFSLFAEKPVCLINENNVVFSNLKIPNDYRLELTTPTQNIKLDYRIYSNAVNSQKPKSINIAGTTLTLTSDDQELTHCIGNATPNQQNQFIPVLEIDGYQQKHFRLISSQNQNRIEVYEQNGQRLSHWTQDSFTDFNWNPQIPLKPHERQLLRIVIDSKFLIYDELFLEKPFCFIDLLHIHTPEYLRICFLENDDQNRALFLKDNHTEIQIQPIATKPIIIENEYLNQLEKNTFSAKKNRCIILVEPKPTIPNFSVIEPHSGFVDEFLTTSNRTRIGNGLSENEYIEVYWKIRKSSNQFEKISLCSYGVPEWKISPFSIPDGKVVLNQIRKNGKAFGNFHFYIP